MTAGKIKKNAVTTTGAQRVGVGDYIVNFAADIRGCAYLATLGDVGAGAGDNGEISIEQQNSNNPNGIEVRTYDSAGAPEDPVLATASTSA